MSKRLSYILSGITLGAVLVLLFMIFNTNTSSDSDSKTGDMRTIPNRSSTRPGFHGKAHPTSRDKPSKEALRNQLEGISNDPEALLNLLPRLVEADLHNDHKVEALIYRASGNFSPEQLSQLLTILPGKEMTGVRMANKIANLLTQRSNPEELALFFQALPDNYAQRHSIVHELSSKSDLFSPEKIEATLSIFKSGDFPAIGSALAARIANQVKKADQTKVIQDYLKIFHQKELVGPLVARVVELSSGKEYDDLTDWLLSEDPKLIQQADQPLLSSMVAGGQVENAIDFTNTLLERGENERADKAITVIGRSYARKSPEAALAWARSLPGDLGNRRSIIANAFLHLYLKDSNKAEQILAQTNDASTKRILLDSKKMAASQLKKQSHQKN